MRTIPKALLLLLAVAALSPAAADEEDPQKRFLRGIGKALQGGNASAVASHFPSSRKIDLSLRGVKSGRYRSGQARSLLATYLTRTIQPIKYTLKEVRGSVGKFVAEYRIREDGRRVKSTTCVYLEEKTGGWHIVGIVEY
jgi:hypothetical protein